MYWSQSKGKKDNKWHLVAEEAYGVDDVILPGGSDHRQHSYHVINSQWEEQEKPQQVTPDVHSLIGKDEKTKKEKRIVSTAGGSRKTAHLI